jgi:hypothetical protein
MNMLTDHRRHKMDEGAKQSMKTILLVAVLFFSFVASGGQSQPPLSREQNFPWLKK